MKLLAILRPRAGVDVRAEIARLGASELQALWGLYRDGVVREMYSPGGPGAVLVVEAASPATAEGQLSALPLLEEGVMSLELIELHPFAALEMLFSPPRAE